MTTTAASTLLILAALVLLVGIVALALLVYIIVHVADLSRQIAADLARDRRALLARVMVTQEIAKSGIQAATAAYHEANDVNHKIRRAGIVASATQEASLTRIEDTATATAGDVREIKQAVVTETEATPDGR